MKKYKNSLTIAIAFVAFAMLAGLVSPGEPTGRTLAASAPETVCNVIDADSLVIVDPSIYTAVLGDAGGSLFRGRARGRPAPSRTDAGTRPGGA